MQTQSHFLLTWFLEDRLRDRLSIHMPALLVGSVAPDIPLFVLTAWFFAVPRRRQGAEELFGSLYDEYFFNDPVWIISHNLLHAPLVLLLLMGLGIGAHRLGQPLGRALAWFAVACAFHSFVDVFTHRDDGPLLLFPLNWTYRFQTPVSYWDPQHGGRLFLALELVMGVLLIGYFTQRWLRSRRPGSKGADTGT